MLSICFCLECVSFVNISLDNLESQYEILYFSLRISIL